MLEQPFESPFRKLYEQVLKHDEIYSNMYIQGHEQSGNVSYRYLVNFEQCNIENERASIATR